MLKRSAVLALLLLAPARAQTPDEWIHLKRETSFSGSWMLDRSASDTLKPMMAAEGIGALERGIYAGLTIHLTIAQDGPSIHIQQSASLFQSVEDLKMDGTREEHKVPYLGTVQTRTYWDSDHTVLVTVTDLKAGDGKPAVATVRRSLADRGKTLVQDLSLTTADGKTLRATRRFHRVP